MTVWKYSNKVPQYLKIMLQYLSKCALLYSTTVNAIKVYFNSKVCVRFHMAACSF